MKKRVMMAMAAAGMMLLGACKGPQDHTQVKANLEQDFFMLRQDTLGRNVDLNQDISNLNYQNLRLLRSYVYATHGHWFMEGDLNTFFSQHTHWYEELCYLEIEEKPYEEGLDPKESDRIKEYAQALWENYPHAYELVNLSQEEKAFVEKIDKRMAELMESKEYAGEDDALLLNPNLAVNWFQISKPDPMLTDRLMKSNVAFNRTKLEQLFQVYEENDYHMMPNFITTDLLLQAYHMFFAYTLTSVERHTFKQQLADVYGAIMEQNKLALKGNTDEEQKDYGKKTAAFCAVALKLLGEDITVPTEVASVVDKEVKLVMAASDQPSPLFETDVDFNYSLFRPRGHYTRTEGDKRYFRAMQWLQKGCFYREKPEQLKWGIYMAELINMLPNEIQRELNSLNDALTFMMGEPDNLSIIELTAQLKHKGVGDMQMALQETTVEAIDSWMQEAGKSRNRIAPKIAIGPQDQLNLMPQRYTVDGDILGCMYDEKANAERPYPMGLDVFAAFGVKSARMLLDTCYHSQEKWPAYKQTMDSLKNKLKNYDRWDASFYNKWLENLIVLQKQNRNMPGFMQTSTWERKNLNTALASWALLKHDAILYAEQPMAAECGGGGLPDPYQVGYVEPNVPFWKKLKETIDKNQLMLKKYGMLTEDLAEKSELLEGYIDFCLRVSESEINGEALSREDFGRIKSFGADMEYFTLSVLDPDQTLCEWSEVKGADRMTAQVADVFTRNVMGCEKDGILYEATGTPNEIYVVVEINGQCYLSRGATYSYYEMVRPLNQPRLTDEEWQEMLLDDSTTPEQTEWFAPLLMSKPIEADERYIYSTGC